jgi:hypothetical protein
MDPVMMNLLLFIILPNYKLISLGNHKVLNIVEEFRLVLQIDLV